MEATSMSKELDTLSGDRDSGLNLEVGIFSEREQVLERFATTPMAYEGADGIYTATGSHQAVALCEFLQNDKLPAAYLEVQFEMAAQRYLSLENEAKSDEDPPINGAFLEVAENRIEQSKKSDHVVENPRKTDVDQANTSLFIETETRTLEHQSESAPDAQAPDKEPSGNERPRDQSADIPVTVTVTAAVDKGPSEREVATSPVISLRPPESVTAPTRTELSQHKQPDVVDQAKNVTDDTDRVKLSSIANEVVFELASDATAKLLDFQEVSPPVPSETAAPDLEQSTINERLPQETAPHVLGESQAGKGEGLEDREQYVAYDDELKITAISSLLTNLSVIAHEPDVTQHENKNDLKVGVVDIGEDQESEARLTALYQCIEAQVSLLETKEYEEIITGERALPVHITSAFIELLEAAGYANPDYALEVYTQKYGVAELLDNITELTPRKTVRTDIHKHTKLARFVIHNTMEQPQAFLRGTVPTMV